MVNRGMKGITFNLEVKKPHSVAQYNKFIKRVDRVDYYLSYYSILRKTV
jgi:hypothetical protein